MNKKYLFYDFSSINAMPEIPTLKMPDYDKLCHDFKIALLESENGVFSISKNGHPKFGAYVMNSSNEMVTWGVLTVGEFLLNNSTDWIAQSYGDFFNETLGLYLNSKDSSQIEYWYLFYANALAGAVYRCICDGDPIIKEKLKRSCDSLFNLALEIDFDFNDQGYDFNLKKKFTKKDSYRQPDTIAGFAYQMLFAACNLDKPGFIDESYDAIKRYLSFEKNPWYEVPNGSSGLLTVAWLNAHGYEMDVKKACEWLFDPEEGPLQLGEFGEEGVDGLMMGWRGYSRENACFSAYSMETLMPLQFILPSVRYCPALANDVAIYAINALTNFQLFYGIGKNKLYETKPEYDADIPYEKIEHTRDGHTPAACGDFYGHRSVYGGGYIYWVQALARPTTNPSIVAFDLSLTDWLAREVYPVFLLKNPFDCDVEVEFTPAEVWSKKQPSLYKDGHLLAKVWDLINNTSFICDSKVNLILNPHEVKLISVIDLDVMPYIKNDMIFAKGVELCSVLN